jgi:hypothetical protein
MRRTPFFAVAVVLTLASSLAVASYALGRSETLPQLRPNLPAAALPTISLDQAARVQLNNAIGAPNLARFGITPDSYAAVRRLANTSVGTFYLVPGARGACIVTQSAASCGDPGAPDQPMLALARAPAADDPLVGVGIATAATERVTMPTGSGVARLPVSEGLFHIRVPASINPAAGTFEAAATPTGAAAPGSQPGGYQSGDDPVIEQWCTHYSDTYGTWWIQSQSQQGVCYQYYSIHPWFYKTNSVAIRTSNILSYETEANWHWLYYLNSDDTVYDSQIGFGQGSTMGGSGGQHKKAACTTHIEGAQYVWWSMFCTTWWDS